MNDQVIVNHRKINNFYIIYIRFRKLSYLFNNFIYNNKILN